jgi:hypothetical protein
MSLQKKLSRGRMREDFLDQCRIQLRIDYYPKAKSKTEGRRV